MNNENEKTKIKIIIPGEPKGKGRPRFRNAGKFVQTYTDKDTVNYENLVRMCYKSQNNINYVLGEQLNVNVKIFQNIPKSTSNKKTQLMLAGYILPTKKPDIDNILKAIFDGLNGVAFRDDSQIVGITAFKNYALEPRVEVELWEVNRNESNI